MCSKTLRKSQKIKDPDLTMKRAKRNIAFKVIECVKTMIRNTFKVIY
jgi:hypothetical protein